tara:strand:+ start:164727 stop:165920 length:1194 start_codon:yes stop_codon:yes gene_type:complete
MHVDMNAFFASIEQRDFIYLRNKPVAITNGLKGSCIITCSYEARAFGIKTGMRFIDAKKLCPKLIRRSSRPNHYAKISAEIMKVLKNISPDIEIFSVDEAFLDLTRYQKIYFSPFHVAYLIKHIIYNQFGLTCSIGISDNKSTAKFASKLKKPNGITLIKPQDAEKILSNYPVTELCGVAKGVKEFLKYHGVLKCKDMKKIPISILGNRFGNIGKKIWMMAQGKDIDSLNLISKSPKSIGHGKVTKPNTQDDYEIRYILYRMSEKVAARMRSHNYESNKFFIGIKIQTGWISDYFKTKTYINNGKNIFDLCISLLNTIKIKYGVFQVQVTAVNPKACNTQKDLFDDVIHQRILDSTIDKLNEKFGRLVVIPARLNTYQESPDVISPSWRPSGHRKSL